MPGGLELTQEVRVVPREWGGACARAGDQGPKGPSCQAQLSRKPDKLCSSLELGGVSCQVSKIAEQAIRIGWVWGAWVVQSVGPSILGFGSGPDRQSHEIEPCGGAPSSAGSLLGNFFSLSPSHSCFLSL